MWHLPLFEAPNGLAEALIQGRERMFVEHFMRQQSSQPQALDSCLEEYALRLAPPGALRGGIEYFRTHRIDALDNQSFALTKLSMPVLSVGGTEASGIVSPNR